MSDLHWVLLHVALVRVALRGDVSDLLLHTLHGGESARAGHLVPTDFAGQRAFHPAVLRHLLDLALFDFRFHHHFFRLPKGLFVLRVVFRVPGPSLNLLKRDKFDLLSLFFQIGFRHLSSS